MSNVPSNWREWASTNYVRGVDPQVIEDIMVQNGVGREDARQEIDVIRNHPYVHSHLESYKNLQKREWLLMVLDKYFRANKKYSLKIDRKNKLPPFKTFMKNYYYENKPLVVRNAINNWPAKNWTLQMLREVVGNPEVEVQYGREADANFEQNSMRLKKMMKFQDFIDEILSVGKSNNLYLTANNADKNKSSLSMLYKDIKQLGDDYLDMSKVDLSFIWIGPRGTYTPMHHDLTNNMFVQVLGRKRFWMAPAIEVPILYNSAHVYSHAELGRPDFEKYPLLKRANIMEFDVYPGDFLFIPIGWWHSVEALDNSISISSNIFNEANNEYTSFPVSYARY